MRKIKSGTIIGSPGSGYRFQVAELLGQGGFGCAYRVHLLDAKGRPIGELCLKVTLDPEGWHHEAYFGELLRRCDRAIRMYESFPLFPARTGQDILYCLVFELAEGGTIWDYLDATRKPWSSRRAAEEITALLKLLDLLHGTGALHRDITPMNVFVCGNRRLKLGDFGIARHVLAGKQATASVFNPGFVSVKMAQRARRYWLASDDVYQMGQLLAMLLRGNPYDLIAEQDVKDLPCDDELKRIIAKAVGPRKSRYENACEMLRALKGDHGSKGPCVDSLAGKTVVFTGPLSLPRFDAEVLVRQAGGSVADDVSKRVDVLVQGGRSRFYSKGHKGEKLCKAEKLIRQGHPISILNEREFLGLVGL
ncbi:MAG TPA: protein kinase [Gemmataceae bacterium]|nr:protein kinase [Gemmataceae bacterium]